MPRSKPTQKIDVIGNLDLRPENAVDDYFASKQQEKFFLNPPQVDFAGDSIELLYIANAREHEAMLRLQGDMLSNAKRQSIINVARIQKMYKTQERLRKRFIEVNSFMKDCADKKRTAEKSIENEKALHEQLTNGIENFKISIDELTAFREALKATVEEFQPYEKVLDDVVKVSDIFVSPKDCMDRCDALMLAQVEINQLDQMKLQEIEDMRHRMVAITNEAALTVLGLKNDLAKLERSYNQSHYLCLKWEKILANCKDVVRTNYMDKERTIDAIVVLYRLLCKRRDIDTVYHRRNVANQLDFIKREVEILQSIINTVEQRNASKTSDRVGSVIAEEDAFC